MIEKDKSEIQELCTAKNAIDSRYIDPASVAIAHWVRYKCHYGCSGYGKSLCCPPHSPTPDQTLKIVSEYSLGLLVHFAQIAGITEAIVEIERELFLRNYYKAIGFGAGSCKLCQECSLDQCRDPKHARPSMEACGIDVYATARSNGFPIDVVKTRDEQENCYGLLLIE
jgi:predicted metal-binding protein